MPSLVSRTEFIRFPRLVAESVPASLDVRFILDNHAARESAGVRRWLIRHSRFHVQFMPTQKS